MIESLFKLFKEVPLAEYTEKTIAFLLLYFQNIFKSIARRRAEAAKLRTAAAKNGEKDSKFEKALEESLKPLKDDPYELYNFDLFWSVIVAPESLKLGTKTKEDAVEGFTKVLLNQQELIESYLAKAGKGIVSGSEGLLCQMSFFRKMFLWSKSKENTNDSTKYFDIKSSLFGIVYKNLIKYKADVSATLSQNPSIESIMSHVFAWTTHFLYRNSAYQRLIHNS